MPSSCAEKKITVSPNTAATLSSDDEDSHREDDTDTDPDSEYSDHGNDASNGFEFSQIIADLDEPADLEYCGDPWPDSECGNRSDSPPMEPSSTTTLMRRLNTLQHRDWIWGQICGYAYTSHDEDRSTQPTITPVLLSTQNLAYGPVPSAPSAMNIVATGRSKRTQESHVERQKLCDCDRVVTRRSNDQRRPLDDPTVTIKCSKAGCESIWPQYHLECTEVKRRRKGWQVVTGHVYYSLLKMKNAELVDLQKCFRPGNRFQGCYKYSREGEYVRAPDLLVYGGSNSKKTKEMHKTIKQKTAAGGIDPATAQSKTIRQRRRRGREREVTLPVTTCWVSWIDWWGVGKTFANLSSWVARAADCGYRRSLDSTPE
ncbi:hypothetical protein DFH09DRAFT_1095942 [Mycena vulgaris]|nr:hypothetical protein DFH09DRAFT_1095942 [Mycena vulgaris]